MKGHPHLRNHPGSTAKAANNYYSTMPDYAACESDMFRLNPGDLIFAITDGTEIVCFGKNVNFLWPAEKSVAQLMGAFAARRNEDASLGTSDWSEATYGFIGDHNVDRGTHPFRGRVRFTTLWGPAVNSVTPATVRLMPLTSPGGTRAKARTLYIEAKNASTPGDFSSTPLRGRKLYWHQHTGDDRVALQHDHGRLAAGAGTTAEKQLGPAIRPLDAGTVFEGVIYFDNLTNAELGALVISLKPDLAFDKQWKSKEKPGYGIKIGKGKPRGLGSVVAASLNVEILGDIRTRYQSLGPSAILSADLDSIVAEYKSSLPNWETLPSTRALAKLLRLPDAPSVRVYPPRFDMYGWLPEVNDKDGTPKGRNFPKPMAKAEELDA